jgi:hypothetical protein
MRRAIVLFTALAVMAAASNKAKDLKKLTASSGAENDHVELQATVLLDKDDIRNAVGAELPAGIAVVQIKAIPKGDDALSIGRDDFTLVSHKDGQRSGPYSPGQIAGKDVLVVKQRTVDGGGTYRQNDGPVWGGIPGTMGRPRQMPGGGGIGSTPSQNTEAEAKVETAKDDKDKGKVDPLLATLESKTLPDSEETKEPVAGLLFFPLEGKQKAKDLELLYKGPAGRLFIPFKQ